MRLAIVNLTGGGFSGGYKKYLKNMLPRLVEHNDVDALMCVSPEGNDIPAWFRKPLAADYCSCSPLTLSYLAHIPDRKMTECLRKFSPDIIFLPVDRYIRFNDVPVVNMVRNMEPFVQNMKGDTPQEMFKKFIQRKLTCNSVRRADHTIAVSGFVKDYLTDKLHVPKSKVSHVYHGLTPPLNGNWMRPVSVPIGWDGGFLFTCGSVRPARGLEDALNALSNLRTRNLNMRLVIAGETVPGMKKYRDGLARLLVLRGLTDSVCWAGNLNDKEMRWCYNRCSFFLMTSRIEACPNIAMEAMSSGDISIVANNPPLPEFFADCATYYEAGKGRSLAEAVLDRMALCPGERRTLSERSRKRSLTFSWDLTVDKTMAVLMQVLKLSKSQKGHSL
ncbi:MAG: glycosyltransferase [Candidatus Omnitrophota bacterium]